MTKLPNIENSELLAKIIKDNASTLMVNDHLRTLIEQNIERFTDETVRTSLYELMRVKVLEQNG